MNFFNRKSFKFGISKFSCLLNKVQFFAGHPVKHLQIKLMVYLLGTSFQLNIIFMWIARSCNVCLSMKYVFGLFAMFVISHKSF